MQWQVPVVSATREAEAGESLNRGSGGCSEPRSRHCTPTWPQSETLSQKKKKVRMLSQAQWLTPIIPALWEAKVGGSPGKEMETILTNIVKPRLY